MAMASVSPARQWLRTLLLLVAGMLILALAPQASWAAHPEQTYRVVAVEYDDVLNIRAGPSVGYPIIGMIPPGGRGVRVIGSCHGWCPISYRGASGWVHARYLAADPALPPEARGYVAEPPPPAPKRPAAVPPRKLSQLPTYWRVTGIPTGDSLKVHETPSPTAPVVHAIDPQAGCIRLTGNCQKPWCQVRFSASGGNRMGWVDSKNLVPSDAGCTR